MNEQPVVTPTPASPVPQTSTNGLAIAALVIGVIAFLTGIIPFWGVLLGLTAIVLGIIGLRRSDKKAFAVIGLIGGALAFLASLVTSGLLIYGFLNPVSNVSPMEMEQRQFTEELLKEKKEYAKGEVMYFNGWTLKINSVERNRYYYDNPAHHFDDIDPNSEFILVNFTVTNTNIPVEDLPFLMDNSFELTDGNKSYQTVFSSPSTPEPKIKGKSYEIGESQTGNLLFEVPKGTAEWKLLVDFTSYLSTAKEQGYAKPSETLRYTLPL